MIGAAGGIGKWLVETVLSREENLHLTLADTDASVREIAEKLSLRREGRVINGRPVSFPTPDAVSGIGDPSSYDAILVAVPIEEIERISKTVLSRARPGGLVVDVASVKAGPIETMLAAVPPGVSVIGTHPMFGPRVESLMGQTVVVCETSSADPRHVDAVKALIERYGGVVQDLTPKKHDELMLVVQGLPHFVHLALGETLRQGGWDLRDTLSLQTPPFRSAASVLGRLVDLQGERQAQLYATIQQTPGSSQLRKEFLAAATELDRLFDEGSISSAQGAIENIARHFPPSAIGQLSAQSDEVVRAGQALEVELQGLKESGRVTGFENHDKQVVIGRVADFDPISIELTGNLIEAHGKLAAIYDDLSQEAAGQHGIAGLPRTQKLPRRNHRLLRQEEVLRWRETALDPHRVDITVGIPLIANVAAVSRYLVDLIPEVLSAEVGPTYVPDDSAQLRQVTFHLQIIGDRLPRQVTSAVVEFVESIGGEAPRASGAPKSAGVRPPVTDPAG